MARTTPRSTTTRTGPELEEDEEGPDDRRNFMTPPRCASDQITIRTNRMPKDRSKDRTGRPAGRWPEPVERIFTFLSAAVTFVPPETIVGRRRRALVFGAKAALW